MSPTEEAVEVAKVENGERLALPWRHVAQSCISVGRSLGRPAIMSVRASRRIA